MTESRVTLVVLGTAQDGGAPQIGHDEDPAWVDPAARRLATSLGLVDRASGRRWLIDATPDIRDQLHRFHAAFPPDATQAPLDGVFLTHAHIGHYTGLMFFGHEAMGTKELPVYALPRMRRYLSDNGPWSQLVSFRNIALQPLADGIATDLGNVRVTPFLVPHRQEFSEVCGFRIEGPARKVLFIPDIDRWEDWDAWGVRVEDEIARGCGLSRRHVLFRRRIARPRHGESAPSDHRIFAGALSGFAVVPAGKNPLHPFELVEPGALHRHCGTPRNRGRRLPRGRRRRSIDSLTCRPVLAGSRARKC